MSASPVDKDLVKTIAQQICRMKGIEVRRKAIKELSIQHGGHRRVAFEDALRTEIDRIWISRKTEIQYPEVREQKAGWRKYFF